MIIKLSPQVRDDNKIWYKVEEQKITATIDGVLDTFDFTDMPNGELQLYDTEGESIIETTLDEVPILSAKKIDGVLTVEILFSIDTDEQDKRLLFPESMTLDEFNDLMDELVERKRMFKDGGKESEDVRGETGYIDIEEIDF